MYLELEECLWFQSDPIKYPRAMVLTFEVAHDDNGGGGGGGRRRVQDGQWLSCGRCASGEVLRDAEKQPRVTHFHA
jgi:hypothetical protein